jgi:hypothetical protein
VRTTCKSDHIICKTAGQGGRCGRLAKSVVLRENWLVKRTPVKKSSGRPRNGSPATAKAVTGTPLATLGQGIYVVRTGQRRQSVAPRSSYRAAALVEKLGKALAKPGISKDAVFGDAPSNRVYSYYVNGANPSKIVRESVTGKRTIGRVVGGKFRAG